MRTQLQIIRNTNNRFLAFILVSSLYFFIALVFVSYELDFKYTKSISVIHYITNTLVQPPIVDLRLDDDCPSDYDATSIGEWPGIKDIEDDDFDLNENCQYHPLDNLSISPKVLRYWRNKYVCIKTAKDYVYTVGECLDGYSKCQSDLCLSEKEDKCPITKLSIQFTDIDGSDRIIIDIDRNRKNRPLTLLEHSFTSTPCYASDTVPIGMTVYPLLNVCQDCGHYGLDNDAVLVDMYEQKDFYSNNWLFFEDYDPLTPDYPEYIANSKAYLLGRKRILLREDSACYENTLNEHNWEKFHAFLHEDNYITATNVLILWEILFFFYALCAMFFLYVPGEFRVKQEVLFFISRVTLELLGALSLLTFCWVYFGRANNIISLYQIHDYYKNLVTNECFGDFDLSEAIEDLNTLEKLLSDNNSAQIALLWTNTARFLIGNFILSWKAKQSLYRIIANDITAAFNSDSNLT